jgi:hypothetical protein
MSDTIQRFDLVGEYELTILPQEDGDYVLHADHLAAMGAKDAEMLRYGAILDAEMARLNAALERAEQEAMALRDAAAHCWLLGEPPKRYRDEWFIAETTWGDRVVLRSLPDMHAHDYKTADDTYMLAKNVSRWMQFPDSEYVPAIQQEAAALRADAELLRELVAGLERTTWSSWQTTAHFWTQLEAAQAAIAARAGGGQ